MSKLKKRVDGQYSLFDLIHRISEDRPEPDPGGLNVRYQLQGIITETIKRCTLTRREIAGKMSRLLNQEISKYMLDPWTAESKEYHRFPAEYLPAFCQAVGSYKPLRFLAEMAGVFVLPGAEALRSEIRKIEEDIKKLHGIKKRVMFLEEMGGEEWKEE